MTRRIDEISEFLFQNQYPCPSGPADTQAVLDALHCAELNKPPVEEYDLGVFEGDTDQNCRRSMVIGTLAYVTARLKAGEYGASDKASIFERINALGKRLHDKR